MVVRRSKRSGFRWLLPAIVIFWMTGGISLAAYTAEAPAGLYTAYNLWYENPDRIFSINYKKGFLLPVGTPVRDVEILIYRGRKVIRFSTLDPVRVFTIYWIERYHPNRTIHSFKRHLFTSKRFEETAISLEVEELAAVQSGVPVVGMRKKAVWMCYGPPPEHATGNLDNDVWTYWTSRFVRKRIYFDDRDRVIRFRIQP